MGANHEHGESRNPIYGKLVDFPSIEQVYRQIESIDYPRLTGSKTELAEAFQRIRERCLAPVAVGIASEPMSEWSTLTSADLVAFSQEVFGDVCQFVTTAIVCYRTMSLFRPLNDEEKKQGLILRELLKSVQEWVPKAEVTLA